VWVGQLVEMKIQISEQMFRGLQKLIKVTQDVDRITVKDQAEQNELIELQERLDEEKAKYQELEQHIIDLNSLLKQKDAMIKKRKDEAVAACPLTPENMQMMAELPGDLEVLRSELARFQGRLASLSHIDPTIAARFLEAEQKRNNTQEELNKLQVVVEEGEAELARRFTAWRDMLAVDVDKINAAFRELMETCHYRGEVRLDCDERDKIESYRISLLVAFDRIGHLNILTATRQSGGEKSVTTLLYLLALQDCTKFPFRVVDEINQGMDEVNDRNTFFQVMSYAMRRNQASQYFLVTPKLLPQLDLMEGVTVLVVMNGPFIHEELNQPITFDNAFEEK
jgi:chromosome segregation ATPase